MLTLMQSQGIYEEMGAEIQAIIAQLLRLLELKSPNLYLHSHQVANYAVSIAAKMKLPRAELERIRTGALLHDVGHLTIPNAILTKMPYLSKRELTVFKNHCNAGSNMLENIASCQEIIPLIRFHHERFDGKGYPKRLKGVNIPLGARIIAVANDYDRYINPCTQNWAKTIPDAIRELNDQSGTAFDPEVVRAFIESLA